MTNHLATLHELETVYGVEAMYDLLEIASINAHNQRVAAAKMK